MYTTCDSNTAPQFIQDLLKELDSKVTEPNIQRIVLTPIEAEELVYRALCQLVDPGLIRYQVNSSVFPDIQVGFSNNYTLGIEVKSTRMGNASCILGNSIHGNTTIHCDDYYALVIIQNMKTNTKEVIVRRYEDVVETVKATHYPRYILNFEQNTSDSFFLKNELTFNEIVEAADPVDLIKQIKRKNHETAYWIDYAHLDAWNDLSHEQKSVFIGRAFLLFPELFGNSPEKYKRLTNWLALEHGIVDANIRDKFSAGGKRNIRIGNTIYNNIPGIYSRLVDNIDYFLEAVRQISPAILNKNWGSALSENATPDEILDTWKTIVLSTINHVELKDLNKLTDLICTLVKVYRP